jgi:hypothetical protein
VRIFDDPPSASRFDSFQRENNAEPYHGVIFNEAQNQLRDFYTKRGSFRCVFLALFDQLGLELSEILLIHGLYERKSLLVRQDLSVY